MRPLYAINVACITTVYTTTALRELHLSSYSYLSL